jgi:DNA-directed RNA polymerase subunit L
LGAVPSAALIYPLQVAATVQLKVLSQTATELEVEVRGENETLLNPIKQALLMDKDVDFAEYIIEHPSLAVPKIFLRTKGKAKPEAVLKRTIKSFETQFAAELKKRN